MRKLTLVSLTALALAGTQATPSGVLLSTYRRAAA